MKTNGSSTPHLLDRMAQASGCMYLSDLRWPDGPCREKLAALVEQLAPEDAPLREWNGALTYLFHAPLEMTAQRARARLLHNLRQGKGGKG